ncbi:Homeobox protein [Dirofilaria immitis]
MQKENWARNILERIRDVRIQSATDRNDGDHSLHCGALVVTDHYRHILESALHTFSLFAAIYRGSGMISSVAPCIIDISTRIY